VTPLHEAAKQAFEGGVQLLLRATPKKQRPAALWAKDDVRACVRALFCVSALRTLSQAR
jgi:hypothetical protein